MSHERSTRTVYYLRSLKSSQEDTENVTLLETKKAKTSQPATSPFDTIPDELLLMMFSHLPLLDLAKNCAPVCRRWYNVSTSNCLWRKLTFNAEPSSEVVGGLLSCAKEPRSIEISQRKDIADYKTILIERSKSLEHLSITGCVNSQTKSRSLTPILISLITKRPNLRSLNIEDSCTTSLKLFELMTKLPNLTTLNIKHVREGSPSVFKTLSQLEHLNSLRLAWRHNSHFWQAQYLLVYNSAFTEFILKLSSSSLMHLEIDVQGITDNSLNIFSRCQQLRTLQLHNAKNLGPQGLEAIGTLQNLRSLYFEGALGQIKADDLSQAFMKGKLRKLTTLGIVSCQVLFDSISDVALLTAIGECCLSLRNVCLSKNKWVTAGSISALAKACKTIRLLDIVGCGFTKNWDIKSMQLVIKDLEILIIDRDLDSKVFRFTKEWSKKNPLSSVIYQEYWWKPHKVFFLND